jgi:4-hydroxy-tetrahydrodipicolinate synthase
LTSTRPAWSGVYPAIPTPFSTDLELDHDALGRLLEAVATSPSVSGVVCGAHAGEVTSLTPDEIVELARSCVAQRPDGVRVVAGLMTEGIAGAVALGRRLVDAGVDALLVMPPHHWLRFGKEAGEALAYVSALGAAFDVPLVVHEYPFATKAGYGTRELVELAQHPGVVAVKSGTRDLAAYGARIRAIRSAAPEVAILTCHDEAILPTIVQGVDGALVAAATVLADEIAAMLAAVERNDLAAAKAVERRVQPLIDVMYGEVAPGIHSHVLLKGTLEALGILPSATVRPPARPPSSSDRAAIADALAAAGMLR